MKTILILGAGKCAGTLIRYLLVEGKPKRWKVKVIDKVPGRAAKMVDGYDNGESQTFEIRDKKIRDAHIKRSYLVISMLPPQYHRLVAESCIKYGKNLLATSEITTSIEELEDQIRKKKNLFLMECGFAPGIDHIVAKQAIDRIHKLGGEIRSFKSYTGTVANPLNGDVNPWNYKFTENPSSVIHSGKKLTRYLSKGVCHYISYSSLFDRVEQVRINGLGELDAYVSGDAMRYKQIYGLKEAQTIIKGTLRPQGFCNTWKVFVKLGMTDNTYRLDNAESLTAKDYINSFLPHHEVKGTEDKLCDFMKINQHSDDFDRLEWLGLFGNERIGFKNAAPSHILQKLLEGKWYMNGKDSDKVILQQEVSYRLRGEDKSFKAAMVYERKEEGFTAMSDAVGLPVAIAAKLIMEGRVNLTGIRNPTSDGLYDLLLEELSEKGFNFVVEELEMG